MKRHAATIPAILLVVLGVAWDSRQATVEAGEAGLRPTYLRCEYRVNPLAVDVPQPRLSWVLESSQRGERQIAYRVLVASTSAALAAGKGDLWDSGRVVSDDTIHIPYGGKPLTSRAWAYWKVAVWDRDGVMSWSEPAHWSMGLLDRSGWRARWIGDPNAIYDAVVEKEARGGIRSGYYTAGASAGEEKIVTLDFGRVERIDEVRLYAAREAAWPQDAVRPLPLRFTVETAGSADFSDVRVVADRTHSDVVQPPVGQALSCRLYPVDARYLRLRIRKMEKDSPNRFVAALSELEVLSNGRNIAIGAEVTADESPSGGGRYGWRKAYLVDGETQPVEPDRIWLPPTMLRKEFHLGGEVKRAVIHATARGVYELRLNGERVGDQLLAPEWTSYQKRIQYQAYDVTTQLRRGGNALAAFVGTGWYLGRLWIGARGYHYGTQPRLLLRMDVELVDGRTVEITSDESWRYFADGPIRSSEIFDGEVYDARKELPGWDEPGFDGALWRTVTAEEELGGSQLVGQAGDPVRVVEERLPVSVGEPKPGVYVFDLGQNMVGFTRLKVRGMAGTRVELRYGEMVHDDGSVYQANLRAARASDVYFLKGVGVETFVPHFTYHGFRYVEVHGLPQRPSREDLAGLVVYSAMPETGRMETSNGLLNRIASNVLWGQRGNLVSIPTDCPQRDERAGWAGDIQVFAPTAMYHMDMAAFFTKWLRDMRDDQAPDGRFPNFAPHSDAAREDYRRYYGAPAWADAGTFIPWDVWANYADKRLLAEHYEAARRWVDYVHERNPGGLWLNDRADDYGDWLNADTLLMDNWPREGASTPKDVFATAFFARSAEIVSKMAAVLERGQDAARYRALHEKIRSAFVAHYVSPDGAVKGDVQGAYALALHFGLLPENLRQAALARMIGGFARYDGHVSTGFNTTGRLLLELSQNGHHHEAYRLVNLRTFPSWGFMIDNGATTIWERWDGYVKGRGFQNPGMNSFNHYAFGAVGEWMWRNLIGINPDETKPGYRHVVLQPRPAGDLSWAKGYYDSIRGRIVSDWRIDGETITYHVQVPPGAAATVYVPTTDASSVTESGGPAGSADGVTPLAADETGFAAFRVASGSYTFSARYEEGE